MRSLGAWVMTPIWAVVLYFLSLGPVGVAAFRYDRKYNLGALWPIYRIYIEPVHASPRQLEQLGVSYMELWCRFTQTPWPGDYTLD